jgi:arylsulfatase A-like enzyme
MGTTAPGRACSLAAAALLAGVAIAAAAAGAARADERPPNLIVFLTDDQRFDTLWAMPLVQSELAARGVRFEQAFVTTPQCCPFRASFLSGGHFAHDTGVLENAGPNGGATAFYDGTTLATRLQAAGYATALIGKYLNEYELLAPYIPPGWTHFEGVLGISVLPPAVYAVGSTTTQSGVGELTPPIPEHDTDYLRDRALAFVDQHADGPFFLYLAFGAPHVPADGTPADASLFTDYLYRERAYAEPDPSDKPARILTAAAIFPALVAHEDTAHRAQLRSLQAVDRAVAAIVDRIEALELLDDTVLVFTSDNGLLWGEHYLFGKGEAYEESIRVPLVVVVPGVEPRSDERLVAANLDVPATLHELAGLPPLGSGASLLPLLADPELPGRGETLLEQSRAGRVWAGLRVRDASGDWKYVEDSAGERELYHLGPDPFEEQNLAGDPLQAERVADFASRLAQSRGLAITTHTAPSFTPGVPYAFPLSAWGGTPPYTWSVAAGELPDGLVLDAQTGVIAGLPADGASQTLAIRVEDSGVAAHVGTPQRYVRSLVLAATWCANEQDDDGDQLVDLADPGCADPTDDSESAPTLQCDDDVDNDGDGLVDLDDPQCATPLSLRERATPPCGIGAELLLPLGVLAWTALRRRACAPSPTRRAA